MQNLLILFIASMLSCCSCNGEHEQTKDSSSREPFYYRLSDQSLRYDDDKLMLSFYVISNWQLEGLKLYVWPYNRLSLVKSSITNEHQGEVYFKCGGNCCNVHNFCSIEIEGYGDEIDSVVYAVSKIDFDDGYYMCFYKHADDQCQLNVACLNSKPVEACVITRLWGIKYDSD